MQELMNSDLNFVLTRTPRDILALMRKNAGELYLAGGFIRATLASEKVSDIDLFGTDNEKLLVLSTAFALERRGRMFKTKNAVTVLSPPRHPVQFITRWTFKGPSALVLSFDFTVCQAAIWAEVVGEDGEKKPIYKFKSMISDRFYADLAARRLFYTSPRRIEEAGGSLLRALKFSGKGYSIQAPSVAGLVARIVSGIDMREIEKDRKFTGVPLEQRLAFVITGLLRMVDPLTVIDGVDFVDEHEIMQE
jgi:hypothetical protein